MEPTALIFLDARALQALGWIHAAEDRPAEAVASFIRAADTYRSAGNELPELICLTEAARAGSARAVLERVDTIADVAEGPFVALAVRHVHALAALEASGGDAALAAEFSAIGIDAAELVMHIVAAEAHAVASMIHAATGDARAAAAADRMRAEQLALCALERSPLRAARASTSPLSGRELEIASLAAGGLSNRQIAAELVLSVRTVETHLQRVYQKVGIRARSELPDVLSPAITTSSP